VINLNELMEIKVKLLNARSLTNETATKLYMATSAAKGWVLISSSRINDDLFLTLGNKQLQLEVV